MCRRCATDGVLRAAAVKLGAPTSRRSRLVSLLRRPALLTCCSADALARWRRADYSCASRRRAPRAARARARLAPIRTMNASWPTPPPAGSRTQARPSASAGRRRRSIACTGRADARQRDGEARLAFHVTSTSESTSTPPPPPRLLCAPSSPPPRFGRRSRAGSPPPSRGPPLRPPPARAAEERERCGAAAAASSDDSASASTAFCPTRHVSSAATLCSG